ncbi:cytochrome P450 [Auricularia subglabra TFB-10046 SS5]|nr:cytochrome P450 [Auricularia subglabra TFB-10046 SS5]
MGPLLLAALAVPTVFALRWFWAIFVAHNPLDNIQGPESPSFITGHLRVLFSHPGRNFQEEIVDKYGRVVLLKGAFGNRSLYVSDPRALQVISVKEQDTFEEQASFISGNKVIFGEGILSTLGDQHRKQRKILNPVFNIKHLRELVPAFTEIAKKMCKRIEEDARSGDGEVDLIVWLSRVALELIGVGGLGYSFGALDGGEHEYVKAIKLFGRVLTPQSIFSAFALTVPRQLLPYVEHWGTARLRRAVFAGVPWAPVQNLLTAVDMMWKTTLEVYGIYTKSDGNNEKFNSVTATNIMKVLHKSNQATNPAERLTDEEMKGQINSLIIAANNTTSRSLCRLVDTLAQHPDYQERVRQEILAAKEVHGDLNFEQLETLPLMDAVIRETLRRYPPLPLMARTCMHETVVPLMHPVVGRDGKTITEVTVPTGTDVYIGILPPNIDYATWGPDAREWKPERWMGPLPQSVGEAHIPGVFAHQMTFLAGNRACIGFKFALLEIKVVLSMLLTHFKFAPGKDKIEWMHAGIYQPTVKGIAKPSLPVKTEVIPKTA